MNNRHRLATLRQLFAHDNGKTVDRLLRAFAIRDNEAALRHVGHRLAQTAAR